MKPVPINPIKPGDRVRVKYAARVTSTHPKSWGVKPARKSYAVEVRRIVTTAGASEGFSVRWRGSGGYWCECPVEDVERID